MRHVPAHLLDGLDLAAFEAVKPAAADSKHKVDFADYNARLWRAWKQIKKLDLDEAQPLDILDIGLGAGYFVYACKRYGHRAVGLDRPGFPIWHGLRRWLDVQVTDHTVQPLQHLPALGRFDLVTSFKCPFNYVDDESRFWTLDEWSFFLNDLRDNLLKPNGRVALEIRKGRGKENQIHDEAFTQFCAGRGAAMKKGVMIFDPLL